jgi:DNA-binding response OmpR family regulator
MRILLVEDDPVLQAVMLRSLTDAGHRVDAAGDGSTAQHLWHVQAYDAVLLDLNLPLNKRPGAEMVSGLDLLRERRAKADKTPVLVLTARNRTDERIAGLDAGADDYLGAAQPRCRRPNPSGPVGAGPQSTAHFDRRPRADLARP